MPPTTVPAPHLPDGVGVRWQRDTGGTLDPDTGVYAPALDGYTLQDGLATGPLPAADWTPFAIPTFIDEVNLGVWGWQNTAPDGTARQPWNGFSGEGIAVTSDDPREGDWWIDFPGGRCNLGALNAYERQTDMVSVSPDGTKVAVVAVDISSGLHSVGIQRLVDGGNCPALGAVHQAYGLHRLVVWAPDSSAIAFGFAGSTPSTSGVLRLAATPGAAPVEVLAPRPGSVVPLGWSVGDRLLFRRLTVEGDRPISRLLTRAVTGGPERLVDAATLPTASPGFVSPVTIGGLDPFLHYGLFVPGTTSVVYQHGSDGASNSDGIAFPRYYVALEADADNAASRPILGSRPALTWHQEALTDRFDPPFQTTDVPDAEFIDRFSR